MPLKTPQQQAQNWANAMAAATTAYTAGIQATTVDPAQAAIAQQPRMLANTMAAIQNGSWANGLTKAAAAGKWKANSLSKGAARLALGATQAQPAVQQYATQQYAVNQQLQQQLATMPKGGTENAVSRFRAMLAAYAQLKQQRQGT